MGYVVMVVRGDGIGCWLGLESSVRSLVEVRDLVIE